MESIVSPWIIYLINIADNFDVDLGIGVFVLLLLLSIVRGLILVDEYEDDAETVIKKIGLRSSICVLAITMSACFFMPSKNTIIAMYVANEITYDRAGKALDITKDIKNSLKRDIIDIIQEVSKPEKTDK